MLRRMEEAAAEISDDDEVPAFRKALASQLLRALLTVLLISTPANWFAIEDPSRRLVLVVVGTLASITVAIPLVWRMREELTAWFVVVPAAVTSLTGYATVGFLSGPGACLTLTTMITGVLLGRRMMLTVMTLCGLAVALIGWSMVAGYLQPPKPEDLATTHAMPWVRSLSITFFAIAVFGTLLVALVDRLEQSLRQAREEGLRREQAERARAEAERAALEAQQLEVVGRLAAGLAHDFNNNLTAIMASADLLRTELGRKGEDPELAEGILQASQRLSELTRQLLAYSRRASMVLKTLELGKLVRDAVALLRHSAGPSLEIVTEFGEPALVTADAALLQGAILNLLVNARDAMPHGGTLRVSTRIEAKDPRDASSMPRVCLVVADTGSGIPAELVPHIFEPFFTTKAAGKGTGLGLAAVAQTVRTHGGSIDVDSAAGKGTTFRIYLPCTDGDRDDPLPSERAALQGEGEVLLVDDDPIVGMTAVKSLSSLGYEVTYVRDGQAAIDVVRAAPGRFRVVLLDLRMPGLSGEATFDALREVAPELPIVLWSGFSGEQDVHGMLARGAAGFVHKPYRIADLSRIVAGAKERPGRTH